MSKRGHIREQNGRFYAQLQGKYLGAFSSRDEAQQAIDCRVDSTYGISGVEKKQCEGCGTVFYYRYKGGQRRKHCKKCKNEKMAAELSAYIAATEVSPRQKRC